jgi:hypothetical protein
LTGKFNSKWNDFLGKNQNGRRIWRSEPVSG